MSISACSQYILEYLKSLPQKSLHYILQCDTMDIHHDITGTKGSFTISDQETILAQLTYSKAGEDFIIIDHTEVSDALGGKGIGKQLVYASVKHAREQGIKIMPLCPFAKAIFQKDESIRDVLR